MRHPFIAFVFCLLAQAAAAQDGAAVQTVPGRSGSELIKASTLAPQAPAAPADQAASLVAAGLPSGAESAGPLALALAALAVMTGIALRRYTTGQR